MRMAHSYRTFLVVLLGFPAYVSGCSNAVGPAEHELEEARSRWETAALDDYRFDYALRCFCTPPSLVPVRIDVRDDRVVAVEPLDPDRGPILAEEEYPTVDELFVRVEEALERDPHEVVRLQFDAALGYPADIFFDFREQVADEESGFAVSALEPLPAPSP